MTHAAHLVQFFTTDDPLIIEVGRFVREGIESGCTCVVIATAEHHQGIDAQLRSAGLDPAALSHDYRYIALDARLMLATLVADGQPDRHRFHQNMGLLMRQAAAGGKPVRVFGEMVALLAEAGQWDAVIQIEDFWNELRRQHTFTLFCAYAIGSFAAASCNKALVCAMHDHVIEASPRPLD